MTLKQRLARARKEQRRNARYAKSRTARIKTLTVKLARRPKLAYWLLDRHPTLRYTSGWRSVQHNKDVGGVPGSWHTRGTVRAPGAVDLVGPEADMQAAQRDAREHVKGLAENLIHDAGSGRHLHLGGQGVIDFDYPAETDLRRLKRLRDRNRRASKFWSGRVKAIKKLIAARRPVPAKGIDVSNRQGAVDWTKVKAAGYDFAWIKSSEGGNWEDPFFFRNVKAAQAAGLKVGAYHYVRPLAGRNGAVEAAFFYKRLKQAGLGKGDLVPVLDVEDNGSRDVAVYAGEAGDQLETLCSHKIGFYTYPFFRTRWPRRFRRFVLWIADYRGLPKPSVPRPWTKPAAWQHTSKGTVPGVKGACDKNVTADLRKLVA